MSLSSGWRRWRELHAAERTDLLATLASIDPAAHTLCADWSASRLVAHLVAAERFGGAPLAIAYPLRLLMPGRVAAAAIQRGRPLMLEAMDRAEGHGWEWMLARMRSGPPAVYGVPALAKLRLLEDWIHHEDLRRTTEPTPRSHSRDLDSALVDAMKTAVRLDEFADVRRHVAVCLPDGTTVSIGDEPRMLVSGSPGEVLLFLTGRHRVAHVDLDGDPTEIRRLQANLVV